MNEETEKKCRDVLMALAVAEPDMTEEERDNFIDKVKIVLQRE